MHDWVKIGNIDSIDWENERETVYGWDGSRANYTTSWTATLTFAPGGQPGKGIMALYSAPEGTPPPSIDAVEHPSHYTDRVPGIEAIEVTQHFNFNLGNAIKYIWRSGEKDPDPRQDLRKAIQYLEFELDRLDAIEMAEEESDGPLCEDCNCCS